LPVRSDGQGIRRSEDQVYVEADGELLGRLPARMTIVPDALSLVVPASSVVTKSSVVPKSTVP